MSWHLHARTPVGALQLDVTLHGPPGPLVLIGPNGSGKTTLLRVLAGALRPQHGTLRLGSQTLLDTERDVDVPSQHRGVGYVPQGYGLFPHLSVLDNVGFGLSTGPRRVPRAQRNAAALRVLETLECDQLASRFPTRLSGGEQQRVALARALVIEPALLALDEPLAALDITARRSVRRVLVQRLRELNTPSLIVTHDVRDVLALDAPVGVLEEGRIVQRGSLEALRSAPATEFVAEFTDALPPARAADL